MVDFGGFLMFLVFGVALLWPAVLMRWWIPGVDGFA